MDFSDIEKRLINLEMVVAVQDKTIDDLNQVIIDMGKRLDHLAQQNRLIIESLSSQNIKAQDEETPPPHY